ncbi:hypothetical protein BC939DRAFT_481539 [Gamsiella multidivaricata]|uniref:uncharacterized protein n=1 Tax=Gamsiella multidivaricata TaxID=101098 RepID=UPI00221ECA6B|nr:uncharacterized protein BC939DRAFT_481539 [Gamsiella multidivaricata]KAI7816980.1 hypothetical protein BC939DRAFT_481539 [Gamsiella multidivaricata]
MPRTFPEGPSIFGSDMTGAWSGGIVYEWSQERDSYGLIQVDPDNTLARLQQSEKHQYAHLGSQLSIAIDTLRSGVRLHGSSLSCVALKFNGNAKFTVAARSSDDMTGSSIQAVLVLYACPVQWGP